MKNKTRRQRKSFPGPRWGTMPGQVTSSRGLEGFRKHALKVQKQFEYLGLKPPQFGDES